MSRTYLLLETLYEGTEPLLTHPQKDSCDVVQDAAFNLTSAQKKKKVNLRGIWSEDKFFKKISTSTHQIRLPP